MALLLASLLAFLLELLNLSAARSSPLYRISIYTPPTSSILRPILL